MPHVNPAYLAAIAYAVLSALFNLAFAHKSQIETWSLSKPRLAALLKFTRAIGIDPWGIAASALLLFKGKLPEAQQNGAKAVAAFKMASVPPPERMFPSLVPSAEDAVVTPKDWSGPSGGLVLLLAIGFAVHSSGCASVKPIVKDIDTAAVILCDVFFSEQPQNVSLSPADIEKAFCSTAEQVAPFLASAKKAVGQGGAVRLHKDTE